MKKLILTIITLTIVASAGCYDPDTATVRINLGNMPLNKSEQNITFIDRVLGLFSRDANATNAEDYYIDVVHIAAYSGNSAIATASIEAEDVKDYGETGSYVELKVPAGEDIAILVIGESYFYENNIKFRNVDYFGASESETFKSGETSTVSVNAIETPSWHNEYGYYEINFNSETRVASWNEPETKIPAKFKLIYTHYGNSATSTYETFENHVTINESMASCEEALELILVFKNFELEASVRTLGGNCK